jgi:ribose-phosphate pyrophosphokinase
MAELHGKQVKLFSLNQNHNLGEEISKYLKIPLSDCELKRFSDGEISINILETVRNHDVFVLQSTSYPVNERYMELLILIDALKRASAHSINIIMPYYGYSRQDRKALPRQPISAKLMADLLEKAGATRVISMDLHAAQIQGFFNIPIDNFEGALIFAKYFNDKKLQDIVVVSPDHGGTTRARKFALCFDAPIAIIDKRRPKPNEAQVMNMIGDVKDKTAIIVDDIVDTAGTISAACVALKKEGAKAIYIVCTHAILSGEAINRIAIPEIDEFVCTNTIAIPKEKLIDKIKVLSIASMIGQGILNIIDGKPVSDLFVYRPGEKGEKP